MVIVGSPDIDPVPYNFAFQKNIAGATLGPSLVIGEIDDPYDQSMVTRVNGEVRQNGNTGEMVRRFEEMISYISKFLTLFPGDIFASGTCAGTALDSSEERKEATAPGESRLDTSLCLKEGDIVEGTVGDVGTVENEIRFTD